MAQFSASIQGTVEDPSGAPVAHAAVQLENSDTRVMRNAETDTSGNYRFLSLAPGPYQVSVTASGFNKTTTAVQLGTAQNLDVPFHLAVATAKTTVEVTAAAPIIDTADTRNQETLRSQEISSVPLAGRNMIQLIAVAPGVTGLGVSSSGSPGSAVDNFSTETQVNASAMGRSGNGNMFVVDGLDVTSNIRPGVINLIPNPDAVAQTSIQINTFDVDYGRASAVQMTMTTKSGTNQFHGLLSDYFSYQGFWAGTEFAHNYPPFHSNNMSANIGGPIWRKHQFFFFFDIEPLRESVSQGNSIITFEDPQFTAFAQKMFPNTVGTKLLTSYPASGATSLGVSQTAAQLFPDTCGSAAAQFLPCDTPVVDRGVFNATNYRNGLQWNARIDKYFQNDRVYGTFFRTTLNTGGPAPRPAFTSTSNYYTDSAQVNETHTFSPTTLNEAAFAFLRVEGISPATGNFSVPVVSVTGMNQGFGNGFALGDFVQHSYHWRDVLSHVAGNHTLKFGYEGWHGNDLAYFAGTHDQPSFEFNSLLDLVQDQPHSESGLSYNPLTGKPQPGNYGYAETTTGLFAEDTWKVLPNLTVNFGLRWDNFGNPYPALAGTNLSNFLLGTGSTFNEQVANGVMRKVSHVYARPIVDTLAPRGGFAWDPFKTGNWVIRGGAGMYHDEPTLGNAENGLNTNPPGYVVPTFFSNGGTSPPIFAFGTSNKVPFGFPYPALNSTSLTPAGGLANQQLSVGGIDRNLAAPTTINYALTLEHRLFSSVTGSIWYQGSHTYDEIWGYGNTGNTFYGFDVNRFAGDLIQCACTSPTRLNPSFGSIDYATNGVRANYQAVVFDVQGRFSHSFFEASYTRSRAEDDSQTYPTVDIDRYYGPSSFDAPNRFSLLWNYSLPAMTGGNGFVRRLLNGWSISGTTIVQNGNPYTVYTNASFQPLIQGGVVAGLKPGSGDYNADGFNLDYPNVSSYSTPSNRQAYLNGVFTAANFPLPAMGTEGNEGINRFRDPMFAETDAALLKTTKISERVKLELRFEAYNVFNRPNLEGVDGNLASGTFGRVTSQYNPRWLQVGARLSF
ncbi:MAG TPA: carboxypeptidase regulatory-like domain-containing protein [Bryobacteraceae bacterium]